MKKQGIRLFMMLWTIIFALSQLPTGASANNIAFSFTASPSQSYVVKPSGEDAKASLDFRITPSGRFDTQIRKPIDVVFIFDTSLSMVYVPFGTKKFANAKIAMDSAVKYFKENAIPGDRFAFVPFNSSVDTHYDVPFNIPNSANPIQSIEKHLDDINSMVRVAQPTGYTNYREALNAANKLLSGSLNDKNIIFLTDGEVTVSNEEVKFSDGKTAQGDTFFYNKTVDYLGNSSEVKYVKVNGNWLASTSANFPQMKTHIKNKVTTTVNQIANNNIKMYSIGLGDKSSELDFSYLQQLSSITGGFANKASENNIREVFLNVAENIATQKVDAEISLDLSQVSMPVGGEIKLDGASASVENNIVKLRQTINYDYGQNTPPSVDLSLPLLFMKAGTYTFNHIKLSYLIDGVPGEPILHDSITITVTDDAPPAINGTMELDGGENAVNHLIKEQGKETNYFDVKYKLTPNGLPNKTVNGKLENIKIIQPLPDGVSIVSGGTSGANNVVTINTGKTINYANGTFNPETFEITLRLKADWALTNVTMPKATVQYTANTFADKGILETSIPPSSERINNKVRLIEFSDKVYDGYANGIIKKENIANNMVIGETGFPNDSGLQSKPIKELSYVNGSNRDAILVTYSDDTTATIYLTPKMTMTTAVSRQTVTHGETVGENVEVTLSQIVPGKNVKYEYHIVNGNSQSGWVEFSLKDMPLILDKPGVNNIQIKIHDSLNGNFTLTDMVKIKKNVQAIELTALGGDDPTKIHTLEQTSQDFRVKILPEDVEEKDKGWIVTVADQSIAAVTKKTAPDEDEQKNKETDNIGRVIGEKGITTLIVTSESNPSIFVEMPIIITSDFVELKGVEFDQPKYTNQLLTNIEDLLEYTPSDVANVKIDDHDPITVTKDGIVTTIKDGDDIFIETDKGASGRTTVTVTVEQKQEDGSDPIQKKASAVFEAGNGSTTIIGPDEEGNDNDTEVIDGRW
jgi:hypothetical protein